MLRTHLLPSPSSPRPAEPWTLRGQSPGRLESFSDCTFSFALTLLIFSLEIPRTFDELVAIMPGIFSFAACFAVLTMLWHRHVTYFLRYGLSDRATVILNTGLLIVVLFYIYPLKFLMNTVFDMLGYLLARRFHLHLPPRPASLSNPSHMPRIMAVYLGGFAAVAVLSALMYRHALKRRDQLRLSRFETDATIDDMLLWSVAALASAVACDLCLTLPHDLATFAPFLVFIIPLMRRFQQRRRREMVSQAA